MFEELHTAVRCAGDEAALQITSSQFPCIDTAQTAAAGTQVAVQLQLNHKHIHADAPVISVAHDFTGFTSHHVLRLFSIIT